MKHIKLAYKTGMIKELFEQEAESRIRAEYSIKTEREILRNMLADTDTAISYLNRVKEIRSDVKTEIESTLGFSVDVGFSPDIKTNGIAEQVATLEIETSELHEALNMILDGVTE